MLSYSLKLDYKLAGWLANYDFFFCESILSHAMYGVKALFGHAVINIILFS